MAPMESAIWQETTIAKGHTYLLPEYLPLHSHWEMWSLQDNYMYLSMNHMSFFMLSSLPCFHFPLFCCST